MSYKLTNDHINKFKELLETFDNLDSLIKNINDLKEKQDSTLDDKIMTLREKIDVEKKSLMDQLKHDDKIYFQKVFRWGDEMKKIKANRLRKIFRSRDTIARHRLKKFKNTELPTLVKDRVTDQVTDFVSTEDKPSLLDEEKERNKQRKRRTTKNLLDWTTKEKEEKNEEEKDRHRENLKKLMMPTLRREEEGGRRTRGKKRTKSRKKRRKSRRRSKGRKRRKSRRRKRTRKRRR